MSNELCSFQCVLDIPLPNLSLLDCGHEYFNCLAYFVDNINMYGLENNFPLNIYHHMNANFIHIKHNAPNNPHANRFIADICYYFVLETNNKKVLVLPSILGTDINGPTIAGCIFKF